MHPGYGFLAENPAFATACRDANLNFIGPSPETIALMGSKTAARRVASEAGVPVVPGTDEPFAAGESEAAIAAAAARIGYPILVKAVAGGGGKGMRQVADPLDLTAAVRAARSEAGTAFGDSAVYLERQLSRARHVEVQLLGDQHGSVIPFVERECSIQRRHQKVIEETPSPAVSSELRARLTSAAAAVATSVGYVGAGTIEFLLDADGAFWFLEMNTRLQVEHPITELVTGIDLVEWQLRIANGERLSVEPAEALTPRGHAIECRIYAEDPDAGFMPSPGLITSLRTSDGPWVRDDRGAEPQSEISIYYDPLISKLAVWGTNRTQTIARLKRALWEYRVLGIQTTVPFFRWILDQPDFLAGAFHTGSLDALLQSQAGSPFVVTDEAEQDVAAIAAALHAGARVDAPGRSDRADRGNAKFTSRKPASPRISEVRPGEGWTRRARLEALRG